MTFCGIPLHHRHTVSMIKPKSLFSACLHYLQERVYGKIKTVTYTIVTTQTSDNPPVRKLRTAMCALSTIQFEKFPGHVLIDSVALMCGFKSTRFWFIDKAPNCEIVSLKITVHDLGYQVFTIRNQPKYQRFLPLVSSILVSSEKLTSLDYFSHHKHFKYHY